MPLAKCVRCQKMFNKKSSPVCTQCQGQEDSDREKVRNAVENDPSMNAEQVAAEVDVDISVVRRMLDEGLIESVGLLETKEIKCGKCGAPAISLSKKLCESCLQKLNAEVAQAQRSVKISARKKVEINGYTGAAGMHVTKTLDTKRKK